ncbi:MAG: hypothetical protein IKO66_07290 [Paludibacteraceae bacterium]|nr:hypothetical protein [Paludibacteraceae bacterium]
MMKTFAQPELEIIKVQNKVITTSLNVNSADHNNIVGDAPERRFYDWDAGY